MAVAGAIVAVGVLTASGVAEAGAAVLVGGAVAVINATVGGLGVAVATHPAQNHNASSARHPGLGCDIVSLYIGQEVQSRSASISTWSMAAGIIAKRADDFGRARP